MTGAKSYYDQMVFLPIQWVKAERYCQLTGETMEAIYGHIREGEWAAGKHYKRTGQRTLWINIKEAQEWIRKQPHVETVVKARCKTLSDEPR